MSPPTVQFIPAAAAGVSLVIHDEFSGTGGLSGRTPDTVDNGNTWTVESGTSYTVTGGVTYAISGSNSPVSIDCGASTYDIELIGRCSTATRTRHGVITHYTDGNNYAGFYVEATNIMYKREVVGGSVTNTSIATGVTLDSNTEYLWSVSISGTSYSVNIERASDGANQTGPLTGSVSLSASSKCGMFWLVDGFDMYITDFKVYA